MKTSVDSRFSHPPDRIFVLCFAFRCFFISFLISYFVFFSFFFRSSHSVCYFLFCCCGCRWKSTKFAYVHTNDSWNGKNVICGGDGGDIFVSILIYAYNKMNSKVMMKRAAQKKRYGMKSLDIIFCSLFRFSISFPLWPFTHRTKKAEKK